MFDLSKMMESMKQAADEREAKTASIHMLEHGYIVHLGSRMIAVEKLEDAIAAVKAYITMMEAQKKQ